MFFFLFIIFGKKSTFYPCYDTMVGNGSLIYTTEFKIFTIMEMPWGKSMMARGLQDKLAFSYISQDHGCAHGYFPGLWR
jgi:hypothetical protein